MTEARTAFIKAATWHGSLDEAEALLAKHPELRSSDIHTAAILGDDAAVRRFIAADRASVTAKSPPYGGDALNYLGLSKYLRLDPRRTPAFVRAATALLDAGADPNTGFWTEGQHPERETALYGAAGVAHNAELTKLLLDRGADPNDVEVVYHSPETDDNAAMRLVVETGKVTPEHLALMLVRKHDWHDYDGAKYLLEHGAKANLAWNGRFPLIHAIARNNGLSLIELLLDHGADPLVTGDGATPVLLAARRGRGDILALFERRGVPLRFEGVDRLIAACARNDVAAVQRIRADEPDLVRELLAMGSTLINEFTGTWNTDGVRLLLDMGVPVDARYKGDGYYDLPPDSTPLHAAGWFILPKLVALLLERGADVNAKDSKGRTPLMLAVRGCVDSYWSHRCDPEGIRLLLAAGASVEGVPYPSGNATIDALIRPARPRWD